MTRALTVFFLGAAVVTLCGASALAADPDELVHGKLVLIKPGNVVKVIAKPLLAGSFDTPDLGVSGNDPTIENGGTLRIRDVGGTGGDFTFVLDGNGMAPFGWKGLGNPAGSKGFKYVGTGLAGDACKVVLVKQKIVKAVCKGPDTSAYTVPFTGSYININLSIGTTTKKYCAQFNGTEIKNTDVLVLRKGSDAPAACQSPSGAFIDLAQNLF